MILLFLYRLSHSSVGSFSTHEKVPENGVEWIDDEDMSDSG